MEIKRIVEGYFSPAGTTQKSVECLSEGMKAERRIVCDLSHRDFKSYHFSKDDLFVVGIPVFAGRVPELARRRLQRLTGEQTPAVVLAAYGNRAFDDALVEMQDLLEEQGFVVVAGVASVTEHSIITEVAAGQPDAAHCEALWDFGHKIGDALDKMESPVRFEKMPGNRPYRPYQVTPIVPVVTEACNGCGICADGCLAGAISPEAPKTTDSEKCVGCMRCIGRCPQHARILPEAAEARLKEKLSPCKAVIKDNELFL